MVFIYLLEADVRFWEKVSRLFKLLEAGEIKAVTSIITITEILSPNKYLGDIKMVSEISNFFQDIPNLDVFSVDWEISQKAAELRRGNKSLRTPDAIQLATAIVGGAKLFVTNDIKLKKVRVDSLEIRMIDELGV